MSRHLVMTADAVGGVWQYAVELARALVRHGWRTTLLVAGPQPTPAQRRTLAGVAGLSCLDAGIDLDWLASSSQEVLCAGRRVARIAADLDADLVQLNSPALAAGGSFAMPVVAVMHSCVASWWRAVREGPFPEDFVWRTELVAEGLRRADRIVTPSAAFGRAVQAVYALRQPPHAVHNGRTPLVCRPSAMHDFAFTAGRLWDAGKNVATLDAVAARLGIPFKAAGPVRGPQGETVAPQDLALIGEVDEAALASCLCARPVFVSAAHYEPFGLAVLEAAAAGCALVLSDIPSFRELWEDAAIFVAPDDAAAYAAEIERIVTDVPLRLSLGRQAAARARRYTPAAMAAGMAAVYDQLLPARRQRERRSAA